MSKFDDVPIEEKIKIQQDLNNEIVKMRQKLEELLDGFNKFDGKAYIDEYTTEEDFRDIIEGYGYYAHVLLDDNLNRHLDRYYGEYVLWG